MVEMDQRLSVANNRRYRRPPRYDLDWLKLLKVATDYEQSLVAALPDEGQLVEGYFEGCWVNAKASIYNVAEGAIGYVDRHRQNDWFDEKCQNAIWELQQGTRKKMRRYKQKRRQQTHLCHSVRMKHAGEWGKHCRWKREDYKLIDFIDTREACQLPR